MLATLIELAKYLMFCALYLWVFAMDWLLNLPAFICARAKMVVNNVAALTR
jgi:hypothetical protein